MDWANNASLQNKIKGMREAKAAFQALPEVVRDRMLDATETTVREIVRFAKGRLESSPSIRTRALYNHITWSVNKKNGRGRAGVATGTTTFTSLPGVTKKVRIKGIVTANSRAKKGYTVVQPRRYAHLVEFGSRHAPAEPFMVPAAESQQQPYLDRCRAAGKHVETDLANIGMRNL